MDESKPASTSKTRVVICPGCSGESIFGPENPFRPFCSQRCKNLDFGGWASENFRVASDAPSDDQPVGDATLQ
jgi:endogenous inhibitor of DNA gyrase (YacG/DUF329 family)